MDLNFLSKLGFIPPRPGMGSSEGYDGSEYGAAGYALPPPDSAPPPQPENLLAGIPGYGAASAPDPSAPAAVAPPPAAAPATAAPAQNLLQTLNVGAPPNDAPEATQPARARSSLLDTVGRISDVLAKVGGANALYQPTLDSRQDRTITLGDHDRAVAMEKIKLADATGDLGDKSNARLGNAVRGLDAITSANPKADISKIWPLLAAQAGIDPARAQLLGAEMAANPDMIKGLAGTVGATKEFGLQPFYYTDSEGKLKAGQLSKDGTFQAIDLDGGTASDPTKAVNLGDRTALVGSRSGQVTTTLANGEKPGGAADRAARIQIAGGNNAATVNAATIRANAPGKGKPGNDPGAEATNGLALIDNISRGFDDLHGMKALAGDNSGTVGNVLGALGRTGVGQAIGEQAGAPAAQKRLELAKNISLLQQTLIKSLPASATRTKFEQEILKTALPDPSKMSYGTAQTIIGQYRDIFRRAQAQAGGGTGNGGSRPLPPRLGAPASRAPVRARPGKPSISNW